MMTRSKLAIRQAAKPEQGATLLSVTQAEAGWTYVSFKVWRLAPGQTAQDDTGDEEVGLVVLSGRVGVESSAGSWDGIGERDNVFDGKPYVVYLPPDTDFRLTGVTECEIALGGTKAERGVAPRLITPDKIAQEVRGEGSARRYVRHVLEADSPAERLFLVEVITPGGNWSSYPPHKHDTDNPPHETYLEETYYHRVRPAQGFAFQRVYTEDRSLDEMVLVEDGTLVLVPKGYHTVAAAAGYDLYYLNVMAGPVREWRFVDDPAHEWIAQGWQPYGAC